MPFGFGLSGPRHFINFGEADAQDGRLKCQSLFGGLSRKTHVAPNFRSMMQADHNQEGLSAKDHISYTSSVPEVTLIAAAD
ncbi:hypothetical protein SBA7_640002 [Candidatus Sulfotelmatobacter sp. SbA7]|nr:hypothetical protein SBA7_640002 [Candidatus Sulfotelmatobacter sp. SbA7]